MNEGDVVQLKCGGPAMVIIRRRLLQKLFRRARCAWFDVNLVLRTRGFPLSVLEPAVS